MEARLKLRKRSSLLKKCKLGSPDVVLFDGVIAKIQSRLQHWSTRLLSHGGKLVLIKHVLSSIPMYLLQVLQPPKAVLVKLGRLFNAFLWDHSVC